MDLEALRSTVREIHFGVHGVPATVTPPGGTPVTTSIIWLTPITDSRPSGGEFQRAEATRVMAIRRDDVPSIPRDSVIDVTEHLLSTPSSWIVDSMDAIFSDHHRVVVRPRV